MNIKYYIPVILIFATILLLQFSVKSQSSPDTITIATITIEKKGNRVIDYYEKGRILQLMNLTKENKMAYRLMCQAYDLRITSVGFYTAGGFSLGFSAGYAIGRAIKGDLIQMKLFLPFLGAGVAFITCGAICELVANAKILKGVEIFNNSKRENNHTSLNLDFAPTELLFKLNF